MAVFAHLAEVVIPAAPGLPGRANDQMVAPEFQFDLVVEAAVFQKRSGYTNAARITNLNKGSLHQNVSALIAGFISDYENGYTMSTDAGTEPALRVMALHALAYCERLFYLEELEEIRLADAAVYAGRRLHEDLATDDGEVVNLTLES